MFRRVSDDGNQPRIRTERKEVVAVASDQSMGLCSEYQIETGDCRISVLLQSSLRDEGLGVFRVRRLKTTASRLLAAARQLRFCISMPKF